MNTLWRKVWADLYQSKSRTVLAIISMAIGVFCVGTLFGMIDLQLSKMDAAHQQSQPSHINLILRGDADQSLSAQIKALSGVAEVDSMTPITVNFRRPGEKEWTMATLIIRPDFTTQLFDKTTLKAGSWPSNHQLAVENLSAQFSGVNIGDNIEFKVADTLITSPIIGIVRHPFVKPPKFGGQIHFFANAGSAALFGIPENSFRQLLVQIEPPYNLDRANAIAADIRTLLANNGLAVNVSLLQDPQKHWGRPFLAGVNEVLKTMALVSLALASVLILNTIAEHITLQTNQIGVMKSLGASTFTIAKIYISETLILAVMAILLALPLSLAVAYFSSCHLLALFNIDCGEFDFSRQAIYWMAIGGLAAPLMAALGPILRGAFMSVRMAIASYGVGVDFGNSRFDLFIEWFGFRFLPTLYAAALGNLFRRKSRLLLTQSVLILASVMFLVLMSLIASLNLTLDNEMARSRYELMLAFTVDHSPQKVLNIANSVLATKHAEVWRRLPLEIAQNSLPLRQKGSLGLQMLALPANTDMYRPLIESGRWLEAEDAGRRVLLLSADTAALNHITVGDNVDVSIGPIKQSWRVIGVYRWLVAGSYSVEPVYAPLETLKEITHHDAASFLLVDAPMSDLTAETNFLNDLKQGYQDQNIQLNAYATQAKLQQRQFARNQFNPVIGTLSGLASMIAVVGGIGLSGAMSISVLQRIREIGVLRAIGAQSNAIFHLFLMEGILHALLAWLVSAPLAYLAAEPIARKLGKTMLGIQLDFAFDFRAVFYWLVIVLLLAGIASYWPAKKAASMSVRESLGY